MIRLFYRDETDELFAWPEEFFEGLRAQSENPSSDSDYTEEIEFLEDQGYREADPLTQAVYFGIVHDWDSLDAWLEGRTGGVPASIMADAAVQDVSMKLLQEFKRLATSNERAATSLEMIAKHAHLLSPPMTVEQVAEYAHVKPKTVYDWKAKGWIKPLADNAKPLLFDRDEVRRAVKRVRGID